MCYLSTSGPMVDLIPNGISPRIEQKVVADKFKGVVTVPVNLR